ncbi:hypothetical protein PVAND_010935 [Polypedilum vanderplanki]|uniref:RNA transcription, translation and transport factor protein n=1 Tax=Polypedilum vanderplanki TaxID=319348 RepID=A0A9J6CHT5_POLVA|nr:hypothetical protein PVAND_010935 [Polypedilum vanderplanki]
MIRNKLICLEHPNPELNINDQKTFRNLIVWLEDQNIRLYKIEERAELRKITSPEWNKAFEKYKEDLNCPKELKTDIDQLKWILSYAIKLEYSDNVDQYRPMTSEKLREAQKKLTSAPSVKSVNPFDNLDFTSPQFEIGVRALANRLHIPYHPDHLTILAAVSRVVKENLNKEALKQVIPEGQPFPLFEGQGMNQNDADVEQAARILRLLQIQSLREMQTIINETIVECQDLITVEPKTDTRLGKVGF